LEILDANSSLIIWDRFVWTTYDC